MQVLQKCFGEPTRIIEKYAEDLLKVKVPKDLRRNDVLIITSRMLDYFSACANAGIKTPSLNRLIRGSKYKVIELDSLFEFLEELSDVLEET